jgi:hypothetical protein
MWRFGTECGKVDGQQNERRDDMPRVVQWIWVMVWAWATFALYECGSAWGWLTAALCLAVATAAAKG